jgi:hypothetical protein
VASRARRAVGAQSEGGRESDGARAGLSRDLPPAALLAAIQCAARESECARGGNPSVCALRERREERGRRGPGAWLRERERDCGRERRREAARGGREEEALTCVSGDRRGRSRAKTEAEHT